MKTIFQLAAICLLAGALSGCVTSRAARTVPAVTEPAEVSYQTFYDALSPYGDWIDYPGYGYAWIPSAGPAFQPYATNGHWVYTNYGWTWVSGYNWGWAPFHYGSWLHDGRYGWVWIPGNQWGPAWVSWRRASDYYGWAPLGPRYGPLYTNGYQVPENLWVFVPQQYITSPSIDRYYVAPRRNPALIRSSSVIRNSSGNGYVTGPPRREVQAATNAPVRAFRVSNTSQPEAGQVSNDRLRLYRPEVSSKPQNSNRPARVLPANSNRTTQRQPAYNNEAPRREATQPSSRPRRQAEPAPAAPPARSNDNRSNDNNSGNSAAPVRTIRPRQEPVPQQNRQPATQQNRQEAPVRSVRPSPSSGSTSDGRPVRSPR